VPGATEGLLKVIRLAPSFPSPSSPPSSTRQLLTTSVTGSPAPDLAPGAPDTRFARAPRPPPGQYVKPAQQAVAPFSSALSEARTASARTKVD
jgi:hypothetical protein